MCVDVRKTERESGRKMKRYIDSGRKEIRERERQRCVFVRDIERGKVGER